MSSWSHSQEALWDCSFIEALPSPFARGQKNQGKGSEGSPTRGVNPVPLTRIAPTQAWKCRFGSLGDQGQRGRAALHPTVPGITWEPPPRLLSLPAAAFMSPA